MVWLWPGRRRILTAIDILDLGKSLLITIITQKGKANIPIRLTRNEFELLFEAMEDYVEEE